MAVWSWMCSCSQLLGGGWWGEGHNGDNRGPLRLVTTLHYTTLRQGPVIQWKKVLAWSGPGQQVLYQDWARPGTGFGPKHEEKGPESDKKGEKGNNGNLQVWPESRPLQKTAVTPLRKPFCTIRKKKKKEKKSFNSINSEDFWLFGVKIEQKLSFENLKDFLKL